MATEEIKTDNVMKKPEAATAPEERLQRDTPSAAADPQDMLVKAMKDAELAKESVKKAINKAFREREESLKRAETLVQAFDRAIQGAPGQSHVPVQSGGPAKNSAETVKQGLMKKILKNGTTPL